MLNQTANERAKRQIYAQRRCVSFGSVEISCRGNEAKLCLHTQSKSKLNLEFSLRGMKRKQDIKTDAEANVKRSSVRFTSRFAILNKLASEMI